MEGGFPVLRLTAITGGKIKLAESKEGAWSLEQAEPFLVREGDFLLSRGNGSKRLVGRGGLVGAVDKPVAFPDTMIRVRVNDALISTSYIRLLWDSPVVRGQIESKARTTAGIYKVNQVILEGISLPLPPLAEQHRIVEALEEQLSRIESGSATLTQARRRLEGLRKRALVSAVPDDVPPSWEMTTVEGAGTLELGRARHPDWHHGPEMRPYLRVANVFEDRIDTADVMEMDFSGVWKKYRLEPGDVLLNEGQSPHLVGRPALYRGVPKDVAFTNSLLRFKAGTGVLPEWALLVFRRHLHAKRFMREVRITTNIAHLSSKRLKKVEFPIPPLDVQKQLVQRCEEMVSGIAAMDRQVTIGLRRADALKSALLRRAFTGGLSVQNSDDEPASILLTRIAADRASQPKRSRRVKDPGQRTAESSASAPEPTPAPALAVQQEFEL